MRELIRYFSKREHMIYDIRYSIRQDQFRHLIDALYCFWRFEFQCIHSFTFLVFSVIFNWIFTCDNHTLQVVRLISQESSFWEHWTFEIIVWLKHDDTQHKIKKERKKQQVISSFPFLMIIFLLARCSLKNKKIKSRNRWLIKRQLTATPK